MTTPAVPLAERITVTAAEAAALFGVTPNTFRQWRQAPGFPVFQPTGGGRPMFPVDALRRWVADHTEVAA